MKTEDLENIIKALPERQPGLTEIKIIKNEFMSPGVGILMLAAEDYEQYRKDQIERLISR